MGPEGGSTLGQAHEDPERPGREMGLGPLSLRGWEGPPRPMAEKALLPCVYMAAYSPGRKAGYKPDMEAATGQHLRLSYRLCPPQIPTLGTALEAGSRGRGAGEGAASWSPGYRVGGGWGAPTVLGPPLWACPQGAPRPFTLPLSWPGSPGSDAGQRPSQGPSQSQHQVLLCFTCPSGGTQRPRCKGRLALLMPSIAHPTAIPEVGGHCPSPGLWITAAPEDTEAGTVQSSVGCAFPGFLGHHAASVCGVPAV